MKNLEQLYFGIKDLIEAYNANEHIKQLKQFLDWSLTDQEFANLIGRCRMYQHLPNTSRGEIPSLALSDSQINAVVKGYYTDKHHKASNGMIGMWQLYNLFTNGLKSSYIDNLAPRLANTHEFASLLVSYKAENQPNWFLS